MIDKDEKRFADRVLRKYRGPDNSSIFQGVIDQLSFHLRNMSNRNSSVLALSRKVPAGEVSVHRIHDTLEIVDTRYAKGGFFFFISPYYGNGYIYNMDGQEVKEFGFYSPLDFGWTDQEKADWYSYIAAAFPSITTPNNWFTSMAAMGNADAWWVNSGDKYGFDTIYGDIGINNPIDVGMRYNWRGESIYTLRFKNPTSPITMIKWWNSHQSSESDGHAVMFLQTRVPASSDWYNGDGNPLFLNFLEYIQFFKINKDNSYENIFFISTELGEINRERIDSVALMDTFLYVHRIKWSILRDGVRLQSPPVTGPLECYNVTETLVPGTLFHRIEKYDYAGNFLGASDYRSFPDDRYLYLQSGVQSHFNYDSAYADLYGPVSALSFDNDQITYNFLRLYASENFIGYSINISGYRCYWSASDLKFVAERADGTIDPPTNNTTLLGIIKEKAYSTYNNQTKNGLYNSQCAEFTIGNNKIHLLRTIDFWKNIWLFPGLALAEMNL
jgi:hypothetical protein